MTPGRNQIRAIGGLLLAAALVMGGLWYHRHMTGTSWDDALDGECITAPTFNAVRQMQSGTYPRTPVVSCQDPTVNYVIVAHTTDAQIRCPDGDKDVAITARIKMVGGDGRRTRTNYGFGWMCAAPVLHEGRCYSPGNDRGMTVRAKECDAASWQVTRRIDGIADIQRCSPATGLVLTEPKVTYCEITAPLPPNLRDNPLARSLQPIPPPAG